MPCSICGNRGHNIRTCHDIHSDVFKDFDDDLFDIRICDEDNVKEDMEEKKEEVVEVSENNNIVTRGTGAGGSNTNKNGLSYESLKSINNEYNIIRNENTHKVVTFSNSDKEFITGSKNEFQKYMNKKETTNLSIKMLHGTKEPDKWFVNEIDEKIYILEFKFQQIGGSVCEKLQSPTNKIRRLNRRFNYDIEYIYALSPWFRLNCEAEIEDFDIDNIKYFWADDSNFKQNLVEYIIN